MKKQWYMDKTDKIEGFSCKRCGNCCKWPGIVRLTDNDISRISEYLNIPPEEFIEEYTKLAPDRRCLTLLDNHHGGCIFYTEPPPGCKVQEVKPVQCCDFPEKWRNRSWRQHCAGAKDVKEEK